MTRSAHLAGASLVAVTVVIAALLATRSHSATVSRPLTLASNQVAEPTTTTIAATVLAPTIAPVPVTAPTRPLPVPPVAVVALVREPEPVQEPAPAEPDGPAPAGSAPERCAAAHQWVEAHGLVLPAGFAFRCPDPAMFADGASRWGTTCWNCGMGTGSYIAINIDRIGSSDEALRYVIAHETCHAIESIATSTTTEASADACAAAHGAPRS